MTNSPLLGRTALTLAGKTAASLLALAAMEGESYGQLLKLGVNFIGRPNDGETVTWTLGIDDLAGVDPQRDWNNLGNNIPDEAAGNFSFGGDGTVTSSPLFFDDGVAGTRGTSVVTATVHANDSWNSNGPIVTNDDKLMQGIIKHAFNQANPPITLTLDNLAIGTNYKLIAYTAMNSGNGAEARGDYSVVGAGAYETFRIFNENSFDGIYTRGTNTVDADASRNTETDYVQWDSIAPDATGKLTLTVAWRGGSDGTGLAGIQLIELPPLPGGDKYWKLGGGTTGTWDLVTSNWKAEPDPAAPDTTFSSASNDVANFTDLVGPAGLRTVEVVAGGVSAGGIYVAAPAGNDYLIKGGPIRGLGASLIKEQANTVTLEGANEFAGNAIIRLGTVIVTTIGDASVAGNLGKGSVITLGADAGASGARLLYNGSTATAARSVTLGTRGGRIEVANAGQTLTLTGGLTGSGTFTKLGAGNLEFTSATQGIFTGNLSITGGKFGTKRLGSGTGSAPSLSISAGSTFDYTGVSLDDTRVVTIGAGGGAINISDPTARYRTSTLTATAGALTVGGAGRLMVSGKADFGTTMPTILSGATLALANTAATNVIPSALTIPSGTLELAPAAFPGVTSITLAGGTLRLGQDALLAEYYAGAVENPGTQVALSGSVESINDYFDAIGAPALSARTNTGGKASLDWNNAANDRNGPPFVDQGYNETDNIRVRYKGKILISAGGLTRFATSSDDGTAIFIDGIRVVNNNFFQGFTERQGTIDLTPGLHDIVMYFYEGGGGAGFTASYQPVGATALAPIPNNVLYSGEVNTSASALPMVVTGNSGLEIAAGSATLGALDVAGGSTLSVLGTGTFTGTTLSGTGNYGFNVKSRTDQVNLGPITGADKTINKTGEGALVFSSTAPANLTVNANAGLVVIQGGNDGATTTNPLGTSTVNLAGGGIGFSSTLGDPTYTTNVNGGASSYRIEAGRFGSPLLNSSITWAPQNNTFAIATGATATVSSRNVGYAFTVTPAVTGQGALVLEQGTINFAAAGGVTNTGGVTVQGATVNVAGPVNTGALSVTGNALGVDNFNPAVTIGGTVTATSVSVARGTLNVAGQTSNSGTFTQTGGTTNLNANSSHGALAVSGGVLTANADLVATGAFTVSGGSAVVAGAATAGSVAVSGGNAQFQSPLTTTTVAVTGGNLTVGDLNASGGTSVSGLNSSLNFNSGFARTITGNVNVTNQGTVRAQSGTTEMGQGVIAIAPRQFQAGLLEGLITNVGDLNNGNPGAALPNPGTGRPGTGGVQLWPRMGETNLKDATHWGDNEAWVYTGQIFDADGVFTFGENIDDRVRVIIDGVTVISNDTWDVPTTSGATQGYGMGRERNGWHDIEIRFHNGGGGAGTVATLGWGGGDNVNYLNKGFGFNAGETTSTNGGDYIIPQDPGDMTLFRTVVEGGGFVRVDGGATLKTGAVTGAQAIILDGINDVAVLQLNNHAAATPSSADVLSVPGAGTVSLGDNNTLTVGVISANDGFLVLNKADGPGTGGTVRVTGSIPGSSGLLSSNIGSGTLNVQGVRLVLNSALQGTGALTASAGGVVTGTGSIAGSLAANAGGTVAPGDNGVGLLTVGSLAITGGKLQLEISSTDSYDSLTVLTGGVNLTGGTLEGLLTNFTMTPGQVIYVINNLGAGPVVGTFAGAPDGSTMTFGARQFQISYDAVFNGSFDNGGNDVALRLIPEPGALSSLLGGVGMLCGLQRFRRRRA